jgi:hypothetical protein
MVSKQYASVIPKVYRADAERCVLLCEDLSARAFQGSCVMNLVTGIDPADQNGLFYQDHLPSLLTVAADFHAAFWEDSKIGIDWRHKSDANWLAHVGGMEKDFLIYRKAEAAGKIPSEWEVCGKTFPNQITAQQLDCFSKAIELLKALPLPARFREGRNITRIHGDLHPGNTYMDQSGDVRFTDWEAVRTGLCTEDLAMLLALHIEPDSQKARPLLDLYYERLCRTVDGYPYEAFCDDYQTAVLEAMFFPLRLINRGITDFPMRDRAIRAFETLAPPSCNSPVQKT